MRFCNLNASTHGYLCWWHQITDPKRHTKYHHEPEYWDGYLKALEGRRQRLELALHDSQALQEDEVMPMHRTTGERVWMYPSTYCVAIRCRR